MSYDDVQKMGSVTLRALGIFRNQHFLPASKEKLILVADGLATLLWRDRHLKGVAVGGWGISDKEYMRVAERKDLPVDTIDSVMTSVNAYKALHHYYLLGLHAPDHFPVSSQFAEQWSPYRATAKQYFTDRWNSRSGDGGVMTRGGHDLNWAMTPRYRHTAHMLSLWVAFPRDYADRVEVTADRLIGEFSNVDWDKEMVTTIVATYSALNDYLSQKQGAWGGDKAEKIEDLKHRLEGMLIDRYCGNISGWYEGERSLYNRLQYTIYVLRGIRPCVDERHDELFKLMDNAMCATCDSEWSLSAFLDAEAQALPKMSFSALACSMFSRQKKHSEKERSVANLSWNVVENALQAKLEKGMGQDYGWALSFLLQDICLHLNSPKPMDKLKAEVVKEFE